MLEMGRAVRASGKPASESRTELVTSQIRGRSSNGSTMAFGLNFDLDCVIYWHSQVNSELFVNPINDWSIQSVPSHYVAGYVWENNPRCGGEIMEHYRGHQHQQSSSFPTGQYCWYSDSRDSHHLDSSQLCSELCRPKEKKCSRSK
jgi:hypothetical protein